MTSLRPAGSGPLVEVAWLVRAVSPQACLVFSVDTPAPSDWPTVPASGAADAQLGHALGYVCEVRKNDVVMLNPLGEGIVKAPAPSLSDEWLHQARITDSAAVFFVNEPLNGASGREALLACGQQTIAAGTVRTAVSDSFGAMASVGRNDPCPCGSGRKFKKCHGN